MAAYETSVLIRRYFRVSKSSPEPLDPRSIEVRLAPAADPPAGRPALNLAAAAVLWAHFEACRRGELAGDLPAPWERLTRKDADPAWIRFLDALLGGADLEAWIHDPAELRRRSVAAYGPGTRAAAGPAGRKRGATYRDIQRWVEAEYGITPRPCWIARCKQACGLPLRPSRGGSGAKPPCPAGLRGPIEAAFRHFGLLSPDEG